MVDAIEELLQIDVHHPALTCANVAPSSRAAFTLGQRFRSQPFNSGTDMSSTPGAPLFSTTR
jgi:hypothetical protein